MKKKLRVGIIFGGKSAEHEVSLQSARNVYEALDKKKYEPVLIGIDKSGRWHLQDRAAFLLRAEDPKLVKLNKPTQDLAVAPGSSPKSLIALNKQGANSSIDVAFPVLHGTNGEDGTMQGLLKLMDVPFVGVSVLGSAVAMDKDVTKRLLKEAGILVTKFLTFKATEKISYAKVKKELGLPVFVKPANAGSSVGISKAKTEKEFKQAVVEAFKYDSKILVESFMAGREIEVSVLGNENPKASLPGEVIPKREFYSYEAKYIDEEGARLDVPAKLAKAVILELQATAIKVFTTLCLEGMARVDFFLRKDGKIFVNEVNTIPGFTKISMYPKLWQVSGLPYPKLIDRLIDLAIERHNKEKKLKTTFD